MLQVMATDDSMSDDVFESSDEVATLRTPSAAPTQPSPTGYRDYRPPAELLKPVQETEQEIAHKVSQLLSVERAILYVVILTFQNQFFPHFS